MSAAMSGVGLTGDKNMLRAMQQAAPPLSKPPNQGTPFFAPPTVLDVSGLGNTGVGVGGGAADASYGWLDVFVGVGSGTDGVIVLGWPSPPPSPLLWSAEEPITLVSAITDADGTALILEIVVVPNSKPYRISWRWTTPV